MQCRVCRANAAHRVRDSGASVRAPGPSKGAVHRAHLPQSSRRCRRPRHRPAAERVRRGDPARTRPTPRARSKEDHLPDLEPPGELQGLLQRRDRGLREEVPGYRGQVGRPPPARATRTRSARTRPEAPCPTSSTSRRTWWPPRWPRRASPSTSTRPRRSTARSTWTAPGRATRYPARRARTPSPLVPQHRPDVLQQAPVQGRRTRPAEAADDLRRGLRGRPEAGGEEPRQGRHPRERPPHHRGLRPVRRSADEQGGHGLRLQRREGRRTPHALQGVVRRQGARPAGADRDPPSPRATSSSPSPWR